MPSVTIKRTLKDAIYSQLARLTKALSSPRRIEMLDLLCQKPWTVDELAEEMQISIANASQHLKILDAAHLASAVKRGLYVQYSVSQGEIGVVLRNLRRFAETQLPEIAQITRRFAAGTDEFASLDRNTLLQRVRNGTALLVDVRPEAEYRSGHLRGAISIPVDQLRHRLSELPKNRQIVAYCRGPYCLFASDAVRTLRRHGIDAIRYDEGVVEWVADGLPVDRPSDNSENSTRVATAPVRVHAGPRKNGRQSQVRKPSTRTR